MLDDERCYRAIRSRDPRFDGWFYTAVTTTGIYCRPSCPATTPRRANVRFFPSSAAAHQAGFRACKRCLPDATPGSPEWNARADVVGRAMRLVADGIVDREGVGGLSRRLGYSERHLNRLLVNEVGAGPLALARAQRTQTARALMQATDLSAADVAFAAGFASVRQFNATVRDVYGCTPVQLRAGRPDGSGPAGDVVPAAPGRLILRLPHREPIDGPRLLGFLRSRAVPGVEEAPAGGGFRRVLDLPHGAGVVEVGTDLRAGLILEDLRDLPAAVSRTRRLLDLDADPVAVDGFLGADPVLGPAVRRRPGLRAPGAVDGAEMAVRAVMGQQVSVAGARALAGRLALAFGRPLGTPSGTLTHRFPDAAALAGADAAAMALPGSRAAAVVALATAVADGRIGLDPGADRDEASARLLELPGIGGWTVAYVRMRAFGDPDSFLPTDRGVRRGLAALGQDCRPRSAAGLAMRWRPWRSYATHHLWNQEAP
ncbi:MAG: Ada metal-binding domain-containing protein [Acidimicrobiales bacterium]